MAEARFTPVLSPLLREEFEDVLKRPKFARWAGDGRCEAFLAAIETSGAMHSDEPHVPPAGLRDPKDECLVKLARSALVETLVSVDRDLLDPDIADLRVTRPRAFLDELPSGRG